MRVRYQAAPHPVWINFVGVAGFEPATSCSQSRRDNRATLHPEIRSANIKVNVAFTNLLQHCFDEISTIQKFKRSVETNAPYHFSGFLRTSNTKF